MKIVRTTVAVLLLAVFVFAPCASALDFGYTEIVDYVPDESITFELVLENPLDEEVYFTDARIEVPWGTDFVYSNTPLLLGGFIPSAMEADEYYGGIGGIESVWFNISRIIPAHSSAKIILKLKINDWEGHSSIGQTQWAFPFNFYAKDKATYKDIFIRMGCVYGHIDEVGIGSTLSPRPGTFADYGKHGVFDLSPDIVNNEYGISTSVSELEPGKPENVNVQVWNGNMTEVKNGTVNLTGCGVSISDSTYPYEFEGVNATAIGKMWVTACWMENNITMNAVEFIQVSPSPNQNSSFDIPMITPVITEKPVNICANVTDAEGVDMVLVKFWKGSPWRAYVSMEEGANNSYSTNIGPFWRKGQVNFEIVCFDSTGNVTESEISQFQVSPYGVALTVDTPEKRTVPNVNATYSITLENVGAKADSFDLSVTNTDNASVAILSKENVWLPAGAKETVLLNVTDETPGTYRINVTARSEGDPEKFDCLQTTTVVSPAIDVRLKTEPREVTPGNISTISAQVIEDETPISNLSVTFTTDLGTFTESGNATYITTTDERGIARAHFTTETVGTANITVTEPTGVSAKTTIKVEASLWWKEP